MFERFCVEGSTYSNFTGHFAERKTLRKGMQADIRKHCRACLECATCKGPGCGTCPHFKPIPVGDHFHRIDIDVLMVTNMP